MCRGKNKKPTWNTKNSSRDWCVIDLWNAAKQQWIVASRSFHFYLHQSKQTSYNLQMSYLAISFLSTLIWTIGYPWFHQRPPHTDQTIGGLCVNAATLRSNHPTGWLLLSLQIPQSAQASLTFTEKIRTHRHFMCHTSTKQSTDFASRQLHCLLNTADPTIQPADCCCHCRCCWHCYCFQHCYCCEGHSCCNCHHYHHAANTATSTAAAAAAATAAAAANLHYSLESKSKTASSERGVLSMRDMGPHPQQQQQRQ